MSKREIYFSKYHLLKSTTTTTTTTNNNNNNQACQQFGVFSTESSLSYTHCILLLVFFYITVMNKIPSYLRLYLPSKHT